MSSFCSTFICGACLLFSTTASPSVDDESCLLRIAESEDPHFEAFKLKHSRKYTAGSREHQERLQQYRKHAADVERQNAHPTSLWTAGLNHMADWTESEMKTLHGLKLMKTSNTGGSGRESLFTKHSRKTLPDQVNWGNLSSIAFAVDQGGCGSCWAVTTTRLLAAHSEIYAGANMRSFSTQEVVDCAPNPHNCGGKGGCDGSTVTLALDYVMRQGLATIEQNPYQGHDSTCNAGPHATGQVLTNDQIMNAGKHMATDAAVGSAAVAFQMHGWELLPKNQLEPLMQAVATVGPVAISVDAEAWSWYSSGIMDSCVVDAVISHAVLLLGYGQVPSGAKYWLIQNSWGSSWGEHGNIRMIRTDNEGTLCGIDHQPELGSGCDGGPSTVEVCGSCGILYENAIPHFQHA